MQFLNPLWLYGLFLVGIPIIIHLVQLRKQKTVYFSSNRFIREAESQNRRKIRIRDLLILILRMAIIALVVFAFAKPIMQEKGEKLSSTDEVMVYIDNSFSMTRMNDDLTLLSRAKESAGVLVAGYPPTTRFRIFTNSREVFSGRSFDREETLSYLNQIKASGTTASLSRIVNQLNISTNNRNSSAEIFLFSDFQNSFFTHQVSSPNLLVRAHGIPLHSSQTSTLSLDSCWFDVPLHQPGQAELLKVRVKNQSNEEYISLPIRLEINDTLRAETNVHLPAKSEAVIELSYNITGLGWQTGRVLLYDYPVSFDNDLYITYRIAREIPVVHIYADEPNPFIMRLFGQDPYFRLDHFSTKGYPLDSFDPYKLVVITGSLNNMNAVRDRLDSYLEGGGSVWLFIESTGDLFNTAALLEHYRIPPIQGVIHQESPSKIPPEKNEWLSSVLLNSSGNLQLPLIRNYVRFGSPVIPFEEILNTESGNHLITRFHTRGGLLTLSSFSLKEVETDLMHHPLFIPLAYLIATGSLDDQPLYQILGNRMAANFSGIDTNPESVVQIKDRTGQYVSVPEQRTHPSSGDISVFVSDLPEPGIYHVHQGKDLLGYLAINLSPSESNLDSMPDSLIVNSFSQLGIPFDFITPDPRALSTLSGQKTSRNSLFPYLLFIALIFLLLESILLKRTV